MSQRAQRFADSPSKMTRRAVLALSGSVVAAYAAQRAPYASADDKTPPIATDSAYSPYTNAEEMRSVVVATLDGAPMPDHASFTAAICLVLQQPSLAFSLNVSGGSLAAALAGSSQDIPNMVSLSAASFHRLFAGELDLPSLMAAGGLMLSGNRADFAQLEGLPIVCRGRYCAALAATGRPDLVEDCRRATQVIRASSTPVQNTAAAPGSDPMLARQLEDIANG